MSVRYGILAGLLCFYAVPAAAQEQETEVDPGPQVMSPVDFVELPRVGYTGLSPDGEQLIGQQMLLRAVEQDGRRVLNYSVDVAR